MPQPPTFMPTGFPEGSVAYASDGIGRSLIKINDWLYTTCVGIGADTTLAMHPENTEPRPADSPQRSLVKINTLMASLGTAILGGGVTGGTWVLSGVASPEGVVTGTLANQIYIQKDGSGVPVTIWQFYGTVGTNTGWETFS